MTGLVAALRDLVGQNKGTVKPTLILNGDILELAFASIGVALKLFEGFLQQIISPGQELFDRIIYLPGNHDHHIWEIARETQYVTKQLSSHWHEELPEPAHVTPLTEDGGVPSYLLNQLVRHVRGVKECEPLDFDLSIVYPNLALVNADTDRGVLVHHGHYCESKYWVMSKLSRWLFPDRPSMETVQQLEGENFAWIDFVWSLLGRSGAAGHEVETLYKKLQYAKHADEFVDDISARLAKATDLPMIPGDYLEAKLLKHLFKRVASMVAAERCHDDRCVSDEISAGLHNYLYGPAQNQLRAEIGHVPAHLSFVFGHTHKPFEERFSAPHGKAVSLFNTGGWTVDSARSTEAYGASIALISRDLQVTAIRPFNLGNQLETGVRVGRISDNGRDANAFVDEICARLAITENSQAATHPAWVELNQSIQEGVSRREQHLSDRYL